ncbi:MAG TPA: glycosyltransferase family 39 protein [Azonexus sp.]|nr:glycosyltransferase family 39 protein [Azonexus sp.]
MNLPAGHQRSSTLFAAPTVSRDYRSLLWIAMALMVASRLVLIFMIDVQPTSDMGWYYERAIDLIESGRYAEGGVSTAYWPIGYAAFLAGVMSLVGKSVLAGQLANLALSLVCMLLLYRLSMRHFGDPRIATFAACLLAVYPNHMGYSLGLYSEPLYTALLLLMWLLIKPDARAVAFIAAGIIAGLATLVKAQMLLLAPILIFMLSMQAWTRQATVLALKNTVLATTVMVLTIAPWAVRNHLVMGAFIPVSTNGGMSLLAGNNPSMTFDLRTDYNDSDPIFQQVNFSVADQVAADRRARTAAWDWISENPITFLSLMPKKFIRLWLPDGESEWNIQRGFENYEKWQFEFRLVRIFNQIYYFLLLAGFVFALGYCVRLSDPQTLAMPMTILFFTVLSLVFSGQSRYHAPLMPFVISYAAWTLARLRPMR